MDTVVFKKKAKKNGAATVRKRARDTYDDHATAEGTAEQADDGEDTLQTIEELLEEQKIRTQLLRADHKKLRKEKATTVPATSGAATSTNDAQYGLHDPKRDGSAGQKLLNLLDGQFTGQSGVTQRDQYEELANKYIEERLQKRATPAPASGEAMEAPPLTDEDALYAELRQELGGAKEIPESSNGGVLVWNTGIAEVELPSTCHERTLRDTKRALERESAGTRRTIDSSALPANFSTDFNRHRTDFIADLKSLSREEQRERGFVAAHSKDKPSDDQAVARFRKMESRRRHK